MGKTESQLRIKWKYRRHLIQFILNIKKFWKGAVRFYSINSLCMWQHSLCIMNHFTHFSCSVMSNSLQPHGLQYAGLLYPSPTPGACSNSCLLSQWCHPTISSSIIPFSCLQSSPESGSFPMSQFFWIWIMIIVLWTVLDIFKSLH